MKLSLSLIILLSFILISCHGVVTSNMSSKLRTKQIDTSDYKKIEHQYNLLSVDEAPANCGGLYPKYSLAIAWKRLGNETDPCDDEGWRNKGMLAACKKVIVKDEDSVIVLNSQKEFQKFYAPIEDEREAISYAILSRGWFAVFDPNFFKNEYKYKAGKPRISYVEKKGDAYIVHLFDYKVFGCTYHPYFEVTARVTKNGTITVLSTKESFADPKDVACVD